MDSNNNFSRRNFIKITAGGALGAGLAMQFPSLLSKENDAPIAPLVDHIIFLNMVGGMSHIDTFDPKPGTNVQGKFKTIDAANGRKISEHLPKLAKIMDRFALINSMTSREGSHERGQYILHTNYPPLGTVVHPTLGAWVSKFTKPINETLPSFISIGRNKFSSGYFGSKHESLNIVKPNLGLANVKLPKNLSQKQFEEKMNLLNELDSDFQKKYTNSNVTTYNEYYQSAIKIMFSEDVKVFDIQSESEEQINNYGNNDFGNGCLLARRLLERGVRYVDLTLGNWDTHDNNFERVETLSESLDTGLSNLILDLEKKNLYKKTLIVLGTEFGRTPKINGRDGRDHFPKAFSCLLAGGCIKGGTVIGKTNETGEAILENPVTMADLYTTIGVSAGLNPEKETYSPVGRPFKLSNNGKVIPGVFA
jgi:hypothetical protein